ncbi:MAG: T9SS type A sorting domain-containing protein [Bacteroidetes bacterium]|nr:T9SS type A sorting domain-containing protein [Bacteroidota bacterium]
MNKTYSILACAGLILSGGSASAQFLPNGNFETWTGSGTSIAIGGGWVGNGLLRLSNLNVNTGSGTETRVPADGQYFIGIRNVISGSSGTLGFIRNRFAFNQRPVSMRAASMFFAGTAAGESWGFSILFLKNKTGGGKDTILKSSGVLNPTTVSNWAQLTIGLTTLYNSQFPGINPDTADVAFFLTPNSSSQISATGLLALDALTWSDFALSNKAFELDALSELKVFPNPSAGGNVQVSFQSGISGQGTLALYDMQGKLLRTIHAGNMESGQNHFNVSTAGLTQGLYLIRLQHAGGVKETRLSVF